MFYRLSNSCEVGIAGPAGVGLNPTCLESAKSSKHTEIRKEGGAAHGEVVCRKHSSRGARGFFLQKSSGRIYLGEVTVYNDTHAAMYGEWKLGSAVGCKDVLGIFIGTGIGGAIVSNGKMRLGGG